MRLNLQTVTFIARAARVFLAGANVILAIALTPWLSGTSALGQTSQLPSAGANQAPEECNYTDDKDVRPAARGSAAEASAAADYSPPSGLQLPDLKAEKAAVGQQNVECKPDEEKDKSASRPESPKTAAPESAPAAARPAPLVAYSNGLLTITAHDARFGDVLNAIRARTGVAVEYPAGSANDRVFDDIGPAPMREVLMAFLDGSQFNYVLLGSSSDTSIIQRIILTPRKSGSTAGAANQTTAAPAANQADANGQGLGADSVPQEIEPQPVPPPVPAARVVQPVPSSFGKNLLDEAAALQRANPQMTRGEILAEMQRRQNELLDQQAPETDAPVQTPPQ